jgi:WD40 repeat protein
MRDAIARVFIGDDLFISYSHMDGGDYATALAAGLKGYSCFLDHLGTDAGGEIPDRVWRKLWRSTALVVVGTKAAAKSDNVRLEIESFFLETRRQVIPLTFSGSLQKAQWYERVLGGVPMVRESRQALCRAVPSPKVKRRIINSFRYWRRATCLKAAFVATVCFVAVSIVGVTEWSRRTVDAAEQRRDVALDSQIEAERKRQQADKAATDAEARKLAAETRERQAVRGRQEALAERALILAARPGQELEALRAALASIEPDAGSLEQAPPRALLGLTEAVTAAVSFLPIPREDIQAASFSRQGDKVLTLNGRNYSDYNDWRVCRWRRNDGQSLGCYDPAAGMPPVAKADFVPSSQGCLLVTLHGQVHFEHGSIVVRDAETGKIRAVKNLSARPDLFQVSPDAERLVVMDALWDLKSGRRVVDLRPAGIEQAVFSDESDRLLTFGSGADCGEPTVWDTRDGKKISVLRECTGKIEHARFSPKSGLLAAAMADGQVTLWDASDGSRWSSLKGHAQADFWLEPIPLSAGVADFQKTGGKILQHKNLGVNDLAFSPDGRRLATAGNDRIADLWRLDFTDSPIEPLAGHSQEVKLVVFSADSGGEWLLTAGRDGRALLWDGHDGRLLDRIEGTGADLRSAMIAPDRQRLLTLTDGGAAHIAIPYRDLSLRTFPSVKGPHAAAVFFPNGRWVATTTAGDSVTVWDRGSGERRGESLPPPPPPPTIDDVLRATQDKTEEQLRRPRKSEFASPGYARLLTLVVSPDGKRLLAAHKESEAIVWDVGAPQRPPVLFKRHTNQIAVGAFSPDGQRIVTGDHDGSIFLWRADSGKVIADLHGGHGSLDAVAFSPDGSRVALVVYGRKEIEIRNARTGRHLFDLEGHDRPATSVQFSADGTLILAAFGDCWYLADSQTGKLRQQVAAGAGGDLELARLSPDGRLVVTARAVQAQLWDAQTGSLIAGLDHKAAIASAAFSPDGRRLLTASWDEMARLWDAKTGARLATFHGHTDRLKSAAFSPDGSFFLTASEDGAAKLYPATLSFFHETGLRLLHLHEAAMATAGPR